MRIETIAKNQVVIDDKGEIIFNSYGKNIAKIINDQVYLDSYYWDYSATTSKYRCQFLRERKPETLKKIKSGQYILKDLNQENH